MEKRVCKTSGLELSAIGLGAWPFGGGDYWGDVAQSDADRAIRVAMDAGITYFDSAELYNGGRSESSLGKAIKGIPRDRVVIGTKVSPSNCYAGTLEEHCEASLKRLDIDYIDLYMVHWPLHSHALSFFTDREDLIAHPPDTAEAFFALEKLRKQGKIRHIGVSNFGVDSLEELPEGIHVAVNQVAYSLLARAPEFELQEYSRKKGMGIIAYMALHQGLLTGKFATLEEVPPIRMRTRHFAPHRSPGNRHGEPGCEPETLALLEGMRRLSEDSGLPMQRLALQWIMANPDITCTMIGVRSGEQVLDNLRGMEDRLPDDVYGELTRLSDPVKKHIGNHLDLFESAKNDRSLRWEK